MARRFGSLTPLRDVDADGESDAVAKVIQALVGGAAYLFELVAGHAVSNDSQVTPPNPQGEIGIDLSGPPWGSAIKHPIAWIGGAKRDTSIGYGMTSVVVCETDVRAVVGPWLIWVRPFEYLPTSVAPYSLGEILLRGHGSITPLDLFVDVRNLTISQHPMIFSGERTITTSASTDEEVLTPAEGPILVRLVPGWNVIEIGFIHGSAFDYYIDSITVNQIEKRSH